LVPKCLGSEVSGYPVSIKLIKAKFHYAILVADRFEAGHRHVADLLALC